nr:hypothetical protein [Tanacetum cinerariifolium]
MPRLALDVCSLSFRAPRDRSYEIIATKQILAEYFVKISEKARILEFKRRNMKKLTLTSYTPYPSRKIRRICACTSQETTKIQDPICRIQKSNRFKHDLPFKPRWGNDPGKLRATPDLLISNQSMILFYNGLEVPTRQILDSKGATSTKTASDAKVAIQEMAGYSQKWHNGTSKTKCTETFDGLVAIQAQL